MDIAVSGFNSPIASSLLRAPQSQESGRPPDRQAERQAAQRVAERGLNRDSSAVTRSEQNRVDAQQRTAESSRIINGEVLSSETTRVGPRESTYRLQSAESQLNNQQAPSSQPDTRRVSVQQALQNFQQNEAAISPAENPRQVSGIIDEYV